MIIGKGFEDSESPFTLDDIENYYSFPEYIGKHVRFDGGSQSQLDLAIQEIENKMDEIDTDGEDFSEELYEAMRDERAELESLESEPQEIFEWWAVSSFLFDKLKENGYCVVDAGSCYIWGRTTTGQAILLDGVITRICADMEILEGQGNSWA